jgi:hypothetical protein
MKNFTYLIIYIIFISCINKVEEEENQKSNLPEIETVKWEIVDTIDIVAFNKDLKVGEPTIDVGVYFPSNFDERFNKVTLARMM